MIARPVVAPRLLLAVCLAAAASLAAGADPSPCSTATRIVRAEVGAHGDLLLEGEACPGTTVEVKRDGAGGALVATARAGDCGVFVAQARDVEPGTALVAAAAGEPPSPPSTVARSSAPEVVVETAKGSFVVRLRPDRAPRQSGLFLDVVGKRAFDGTTFHRVVPGALVQGGDPLTHDPADSRRYGRGGHGRVPLEGSDRCFTRATVGAARCPQDCDTGGRQFFVLLRDEPALHGHYTAFGEVVAGLDVVEAISRIPADDERARERVEMKVRLREAAAAAR